MDSPQGNVGVLHSIWSAWHTYSIDFLSHALPQEEKLHNLLADMIAHKRYFFFCFFYLWTNEAIGFLTYFPNNNVKLAQPPEYCKIGTATIRGYLGHLNTHTKKNLNIELPCTNNHKDEGLKSKHFTVGGYTTVLKDVLMLLNRLS